MTPELIWAAALVAGVVLAAALVNWRAPVQRPRVRRAVIFLALYLVALVLESSVGAYSVVWKLRLAGAADLLSAIGFINVGGLIVFFVLFPAVRIRIPMIGSELIVGFAYILATIATLSKHGMDPTGALATGAVVSAVLAISLQQTLGNILGGVALQLDGSVKEGDWIQLENGKQGKVRAIRWRHTLVETRDWSTIVVPNAQLLANNITILGKRDGLPAPQRMWVWLNVDFRYPPTRVTEVVTEAIHASPIENVVDDPRPNVVCMDFARDLRESFATYAVRYWIRDLASDSPTDSRVRARVYTALKRAGIPLAIPAVMNLTEVNDAERQERRQQREIDRYQAALETVPLFASLTPEELRTLAEGMSPAIYVKDEVITKQGAKANWLYVMTSGRADVRTRVDIDGAGPAPETSKVVATIAAPNFFGEMGLMTGEPRGADVVAVVDTECLRLGRETFERVLLGRPEIAEAIAIAIATRRVELEAVREGLSDDARRRREATERDKILGGIKAFFGL
ncbi:MAG: mechanosensitive ion channel family protein [Proteobacteria bacterium]|nr:mechanosensitive ion channel family protein [Pseudomonadota bacterium]